MVTNDDAQPARSSREGPFKSIRRLAWEKLISVSRNSELVEMYSLRIRVRYCLLYLCKLVFFYPFFFFFVTERDVSIISSVVFREI